MRSIDRRERFLVTTIDFDFPGGTDEGSNSWFAQAYVRIWVMLTVRIECLMKWKSKAPGSRKQKARNEECLKSVLIGYNPSSKPGLRALLTRAFVYLTLRSTQS